MPTISHRARCKMVGTLRFAHPTKLRTIVPYVSTLTPPSAVTRPRLSITICVAS
jgi:hypothetical protein